MDWIALGASILTGIGGIAAVAAFLAKFIPKAVKYENIAGDALKLLGDATKALEDKTITPDEINTIKADYAKLVSDFKA